MNRNFLVSGLMVALLLTGGCGGGKKEKPTTTPTPTPSPMGRGQGCYAASVTAITSQNHQLSSTGNAQLDYALSVELQKIRSFFGFNVPAYLIDDSASPNAYYSSRDDTMLIGNTLVYKQLYQYGGSAVQGVLAHEMGHKVQYSLFPEIFRAPWAREYELEADCFSGYYMAFQGLTVGQVSAYFQSMYDIGDNLFNDPGHHGTQQERLAAAQYGFQTAIYAYQNGLRPSYADLHNVFYTTVSRKITRREPEARLLATGRSVHTETVKGILTWLDREGVNLLPTTRLSVNP